MADRGLQCRCPFAVWPEPARVRSLIAVRWVRLPLWQCALLVAAPMAVGVLAVLLELVAHLLLARLPLNRADFSGNAVPPRTHFATRKSAPSRFTPRAHYLRQLPVITASQRAVLFGRSADTHRKPPTCGNDYQPQFSRESGASAARR